MNALKIKKGPILLPLLALVVVLTGYTVLNFQGVSAAESVSVGQQYLNEMDYGGAIAAFTKAIEIDPTSREAHLGLARAYVGSENGDLAQELLEDMVYTDTPDEEAAQELIELFENEGDLVPAMQVVQTMLDSTDSDTYYQWREELLAQLAEKPRSLAFGTDQQILIQQGEVLSRGSNALGQLGLSPALVEESQRFLSAGYESGTPLKASCAGRTSFIINESGELWAAGENRWGQLGAGYSEAVPQDGWQQISTPGPVADAAGTTGRLLVLLTDGSLWTAGAGYSQQFQQLTQFPVAVGISSSQQIVAVLTAKGDLYQSTFDNPQQWSRVGVNVKSFHVLGDTACWVTQDNKISTSWGEPGGIADSWYDPQTGEYMPAFSIADVVVMPSRILLTDEQGMLYEMPGDGSIEEVSLQAPVSSLYTQGESAVLELSDGSIAIWQDDGVLPEFFTN